MSIQVPSVSVARPRMTRAWQLGIGILCMALIANLQYGWTLFVDPIHKAHGWRIDEIQWAFSIFVAVETWLTPAQGWIVDRLGERGPRLMGGSRPDRHRLGPQLDCRFAPASLSRGHVVRHRCRRHLRDLRRQRGEVVS
jgi:hypothetical protein